MTDAAQPVRTRRLRLALLLTGTGLAVVALGLYAARKPIARHALEGWLEARGVEAEADVVEIGPTGFVGQVRAGPRERPDFAADRIEMAYGLTGFWSGDPFGLQVRSVKLVRPVLRARLQGGTLSVGSLDPIVDQFRRQPPRPNAAKPRIEVAGGLLLLDTDYGPVRLRADAQVEDNRLLRLDATSAPAQLAGAGFQTTLGAGRLRLTSKGDRAHLTLNAPANRLVAGALTATDARLLLTLDAPYPDLVRRKGDGALVLNASLTGAQLSVAGNRLDAARINASFQGQAAGWVDTLTVRGKGAMDITATGGVLGPARTGVLKAAASAGDVVWNRQGGDAVSANLTLAATLDTLAANDLALRQMVLALKGPAAIRPDGPSIALDGSILGRGAWNGLGAPARTDGAQIIAVKRALLGFRIAGPSVGLRVNGNDVRVRLPRPVSLIPDAGGRVVLAEPAKGAYRLTATGGGLPRITADVSRIDLLPTGVAARGRLQAGLSIGPVVNGSLDATGTLRLANGGASFTASRCVPVKAERLELGANDVADIRADLCPTNRPLFTFAGGGWRLAARAGAVAAEAPFLQARVANGSGAVSFSGQDGRLSGGVTAIAANVQDAAPATRFNPLRLSGDVRLSGQTWRGDLGVADPAGHALAKVQLTHDGAAGRGGVRVDTGTLAFADGALQPAALSPLAAAIGSPATGSARFTGAFAWDVQGTSSNGVVDIPRLDFVSPAGPVTGLSGKVVFTSLAPLIAASGQTLKAESVAAVAPLSGVSVTFGVDADALSITGGEAAVGGGVLRIETLRIPLAASAPAEGVLEIEGVQLHDLVEASPFGDRVELDAKVSGRVPFQVVGGRIHVQQGDLHAIAPGRLSIQRSALTGVEAETAVEAPPAVAAVAPVPGADTFSDFAYQAMENLAFDKLDATINSLPEGRLGILFHVIGRHDPPQKQQIRLSIMDLIKRRFLNQRLPLPSDTGVNLTLDTTVNLDDLLRDYANYQQLRSSRGVQP